MQIYCNKCNKEIKTKNVFTETESGSGMYIRSLVCPFCNTLVSEDENEHTNNTAPKKEDFAYNYITKKLWGEALNYFPDPEEDEYDRKVDEWHRKWRGVFLKNLKKELEEDRILREKHANWSYIEQQPLRIKAALKVFVATGSLYKAARLGDVTMDEMNKLRKNANIPIIG